MRMNYEISKEKERDPKLVGDNCTFTSQLLRNSLHPIFFLAFQVMTYPP